MTDLADRCEEYATLRRGEHYWFLEYETDTVQNRIWSRVYLALNDLSKQGWDPVIKFGGGKYNEEIVLRRARTP